MNLSVWSAELWCEVGALTSPAEDPRGLQHFGWWGDNDAMVEWEEADKRVDSVGVGPAQGGGSHTAAVALNKT